MFEPLPATEISREELRATEIFHDLDDAQLDWLREHGLYLRASKGTTIMKMGDPADAMFVLLEGALQFRMDAAGQSLYFEVDRKGAVGGALPYSRATASSAEAVALREVRALSIAKTDFPGMLAAIPVLGQRLVSIMSDRVREHTRMMQQREKMMALGKVAAGLSHELNNPAAAARRAAAQIKERLNLLARLAPSLIALRLDPEHVRHVVEFREAVLSRPVAHLGSVQRAELEDELADWLEARGVPEPWEAAGSLIDAGVMISDLERMAAGTPAEAMAPAVQWLESSIAAQKLADELLSATARISDLVSSVKAYSHVDRASDRVATDVREGLEGTLLILGHKLRDKNIQVVREFEPALPRVPVYPGELNQVWTNLIDNAIDAMPAEGVLKISAQAEGRCLRVRVVDNGPGIPENIRHRIFEPFFTTKPVGVGTGLGLDIVQRIVNVQHGGDIEVESRPGETAFTVWLPLEDRAAAAAAEACSRDDQGA